MKEIGEDRGSARQMEGSGWGREDALGLWGLVGWHLVVEDEGYSVVDRVVGRGIQRLLGGSRGRIRRLRK